MIFAMTGKSWPDDSFKGGHSTHMDAAYLFNKGENYMSYKFLGAHPYEDENGKQRLESQ